MMRKATQADMDAVFRGERPGEEIGVVAVPSVYVQHKMGISQGGILAFYFALNISPLWPAKPPKELVEPIT